VLTWPASSTPLSASSDTVADWPTLILLMSDSLKATVIVRRPASMISAKPELLELDDPLEPDEPLELEPDPPRLPAELAPVAAEEPEPAELDPELEEPDEPAEMASPGETLSSEAIVPPAGA
jgi:hypothetical protein